MWRWAVVGLFAALGLWSGTLAAQNAFSEDVVKAVLLERIVTFLTWSGPSDARGEVQLVVLGQGALGAEIERVYGERRFAGRAVAVRHAKRPEDIGHAHIVIIGREHDARLSEVLGACAREGVLTVGDTPGFGERGVAINFYRDGARVRFEVAPSALKRARIQASYKLLTLARVVGGT